MNIQQARKELVEIGKRIYAKGMVAANDGNISIRLDDERIMITPAGVSKGFMNAGEMVLLGMDGRIISTDQKPSSEAAMHLEIYRNSADTGGVCHAHPPYATAFAAAGLAIPPNVLPEMALSLGEIPLVPYATPGSEVLAASLQPYLKNHRAFLLANHGVVTIARSAMQAYYLMEIVEHAAKIIYLAKNLGRPTELNAEQLQALKTAPNHLSESADETKELVRRISRDILEALNKGK